MLLDELRQLAEQTSVTGCVVGIWIKSQDPELQKVLDLLSKNERASINKVLELIKKYNPDVPFKRTSFGMHLKGTCACQTA